MSQLDQPRIVIPAEAAGLRTIAIFEICKGVLVLGMGWGLLAFLHRDLQAVAIDVVHRLHLAPDGNMVGRFLSIVHRAAGINLWFIAMGSTAYAAIRLSEGYGLWFDRTWANWLGALSGGIYLPVEYYEVLDRPTFTRGVIFAGNALIVIFLCHRLWLRHRALQKARAAIAVGVGLETDPITLEKEEPPENPEHSHNIQPAIHE